eukprot:scaffold7816_cov296-Pinguiococcus_pyrenoidosus.AAC.1
MEMDQGARDLQELGWQIMAEDAVDLPPPSGESMFFGVEEVDGDEFTRILGGKRPITAVEQGSPTEQAEQPASKKRKKRKRPTKKEREKLRKKKEAQESEKGAEAPAPAAGRGDRKGASAINKQEKEDEEDVSEEKADEQEKVELPAKWEGLGVELHPTIVRGIVAAGFQAPTPIQAAVLPRALLFRQDVVGAAQTGSGKTLAFGIPLVHLLLEAKATQPAWFDTQSPKALVLAPTRELAMQVTQHLRRIAGGAGSKATTTSLQITPIVGGMAEQKQQRFLKMHPEVIVATPGRFWEMVKNDQDGEEPFLSRLGRLRFLVVDEADRMVETGRFRELKSLLQYVHDQEAVESLPPKERQRLEQLRRSKNKEWIIHDTGTTYVEGEGIREDAAELSADEDAALEGNVDHAGDAVHEDVDENEVEADQADEETQRFAPKPPRQTFIFSATLKALNDAKKSNKKKAKSPDKTTLEVGHILDLVLPPGAQ